MPLTLVQIELALDEPLRRKVLAVHGLLAANPTLAFSAAEVASALDLRHDDVEAILEKFDDLDLVRRGSVDGKVYFLFARDLPAL